ncbi:MAG: CsbD family protein [Candidatus Competibacteraceae bacterium]|nr:CsbD family protein [Candidatus Competibacteraceae bacterium]
MSSSTQDDIKGRVKEATGAVTGNDELKREGQKDQVAGKIKETAEAVVDKVRDIAGGSKKDSDG